MSSQRLIRKLKQADKNMNRAINRGDLKTFYWGAIAKKYLIKLVGKATWKELYDYKYHIFYDLKTKLDGKNPLKTTFKTIRTRFVTYSGSEYYTHKHYPKSQERTRNLIKEWKR